MAEKILNIGPKQCRKRMDIGVGFLGFSGIYLAMLLLFKLPFGWWILLFFTSFVGLLGIFQALEKTCVFLAAKGQAALDEDGSEEPVTDPILAKQLRKRGNRIMVKIAMIAAMFTLICYFIPKY